MNFLRRVIRWLLKVRDMLRRWRYRKHLGFTVWLNRGRVAIHGTCAMNVPLRCDGKGSVNLGQGVKLGYALGARLGNGEVLLQARRPEAIISLGVNTATNNNVAIIANQSIEIGDECLIGEQVTIYDSDFHALQRKDRMVSKGVTSPIKIHDGVWLGSRVTVLKGVEIGANSVIGVGSVVTKSIPPNVIAGGIPARIIRSIN